VGHEDKKMIYNSL